MADQVENDGKMLSSHIAQTVIAEVELLPSDGNVEALTDACHRLLEGGTDQNLLTDVLIDLLFELGRADGTLASFEESDEEEEDDVVSGPRGHNLFDSTPNDLD